MKNVPEVKVKVVVFDVGNVLAHFSMDEFARYLLSHGAKFSNEKEFFKLVPVWLYEKGEISTEQFFSTVKKVCSEEIDLGVAQKLWTEIFTPNDKLLAIARNLGKSCKVGILSNTSELHWNYLLANYGLHKFASHLMPSFKLGLMKPEPGIYHQAERILDAIGQEILFFDDKIENIEGAAACGWRAVHYCDLDDAVCALNNFCSGNGINDRS